MSLSRARLRARGFSLFEVLLAVALLLVLTTSLMGFLFDTLSTRRTALEMTAQGRGIATMIERLERDLATCLVGDGELGSGLAGDGEGLSVLGRGVALEAGSRARNHVFGDLRRTEYRFDARRRVLGARAGEGDFTDLAREVYRVRFRYHDGARWRDSFDALEANQLPHAVEVAVWVDPWPGAERDEDDGTLEEPLDEEAWAAIDGGSDVGFPTARVDGPEPAPDRVRVIAIPDAGPGDDAADADEATP